MNTINVRVDDKFPYKDISEKLFSVHLIPNIGDTFEIRLEGKETAFYEVISKHFIFRQVPSYDGYWDHSVILDCKLIQV